VTDATESLGGDKQYSSKFEQERADFNQIQYSSRSRPKERHEAGYLDPHTGTRAQHNVDANTSASKSVASSSYRSNAQNLKPTHDGLTDSSRATSGRLVDSRYVDFSKPSSTRNPYINRAEISGKDSLAPNSAMDKRYPTATEYDNRLMNFDRERRVDDSLYINRQMPDASYAGPVGKYQPPNATKYGHGDRYSPSPEVDTAQNRLGAAVKKYSSPGEEDLRRTLYDKKYQMEAQKRQAEVLAGSRLQREVGEFDQRGTEHRLESPRGRYGAGHGVESEGIKSANRRLLDTVNTRPSSTTMASSSKPEQYREIAKSTDPPTARKQFTKADRGKIGISGGIERGGVYSDLQEKATPKTLKDDYHRDYHGDREPVSSARKHVQIDDRQPSTVSDREQFQRQNGKQSAADHNRKLQTGPVGSSATRKTDEVRQTSERESSFSLRKMKEDLLRDQAKLDRQLITNSVVSDDRTPRFDSRQRYDSGRSSDVYDTDFGRSSYATDKRTVCFYCFMDVTLFMVALCNRADHYIFML